MRKRGTTIEWTTKQVQQVAELSGKGYKATEIAEIMGLPYGAVKNKVYTLSMAGEIPNYKRATPRRYTPTDVRHPKIRALTDHVLDWVWVHPGYEFNIAYRYYMDGSISPVFSMHAFYRDQLVRYIPAEGDPNWSVQQPCTEDNLRTLLAALRRIDLEVEDDD